MEPREGLSQDCGSPSSRVAAVERRRKSVDDGRYKIRFTPRRKSSHWSARNLGRMKHLIEAGLVTEAGLAAYRARRP